MHHISQPLLTSNSTSNSYLIRSITVQHFPNQLDTRENHVATIYGVIPSTIFAALKREPVVVVLLVVLDVLPRYESASVWRNQPG